MMNRQINLFKVASNMIWLLLIVMIFPSTYILFTQAYILLEWTMLSLLSTPITLTILMDPVGMLFSCTVLFISANVLSFSTVYMKDDKFTNRFTVLVLLFILSMNLLIFLPHFMILLIGWDGLGIVSFILVIYYQNPKSLAAGMVTALTNRIGDVMLLLAIGWTLNQGHWLIINMWSTPSMYLQILCIAVAAMTKSAQMPFSSWLPAAMAAPTPVSALVHSSTLVTAGVFLMIRFYPFLHSWEWFNIIMLTIAVSTMLMAGLSATSECDMKKIIALSTLSQLGMMMTSIGLNMPTLAYYHMITHALFKALLFICAGSFINQHLHTQDLRWMGNLSNQMPVASSCISIANLALCGFPFLAGFYSKDLIMESAMNMSNNMFILLLALFSLSLTSFYSIRFSLVTMWSSMNGAPLIYIDEYKAITTPMILLTLMSITAGAMISWIPHVSQSMFILPMTYKLSPLVMVFLGLITGWLITISSTMNTSMSMKHQLSHYGSCLMWFLVPLSTQFMMKFPLLSAHQYMKATDQGWLELASANGIHSALINNSNMIMLSSPKSPMSNLAVSSTISIALISIMLIMMYN